MNKGLIFLTVLTATMFQESHAQNRRLDQAARLAAAKATAQAAIAARMAQRFATEEQSKDLARREELARLDIEERARLLATGAQAAQEEASRKGRDLARAQQAARTQSPGPRVVKLSKEELERAAFLAEGARNLQEAAASRCHVAELAAPITQAPSVSKSTKALMILAACFAGASCVEEYMQKSSPATQAKNLDLEKVIDPAAFSFAVTPEMCSLDFSDLKTAEELYAISATKNFTQAFAQCPPHKEFYSVSMNDGQ